MNACLSLACWPGLDYGHMPELLAGTHTEPLFGTLSIEHVQLVPQSVGWLDEARVDELLAAFPAARFRLHANVRVLARHRMADLSTFEGDRDWFDQAARISQRLGAPAYSAHAGDRRRATLTGVLDNARRCADLFGCPVAIEGLYPDRHGAQLVSTWDEYRTVFESGMPYALDLSHLNIVAHRYGREDELVADMLACERCLEVHVSDNDGTGDWHRICNKPPWWYSRLAHLHPQAVVFSEGNHRRAHV
ncbi:sugar phosphate isomerase/epimerase [Ralstonia soli]|uniref:Sugar phosphate isomerase/epimerase n=1 Tax=Ralstonia soli TaxID=2953896 RepID=A0ABT1AMV1_9RALS|nr:sugar phosphate isomerase/epimerase [Ralstonia soli]MCO5399743.1 sugar phosphate isomerase/epimerase [Ralstonia soli]